LTLSAGLERCPFPSPFYQIKRESEKVVRKRRKKKKKSKNSGDCIVLFSTHQTIQFSIAFTDSTFNILCNLLLEEHRKREREVKEFE
jgi:hypothetical protein